MLTEGDVLEMPPLPDTAFMLAQMDDDSSQPNRRRRGSSRDINLTEDFNASQYLQNSNLNRKYDDDLALDIDDLDLGLDLGLDVVETGLDDRTMEIGLDAPQVNLEDVVGDSELDVFGKDDDRGRSASILDQDAGLRILDDDGDIDMAGADITFGIGEDTDMPLAPSGPIDRARISESPLSDIDPAQQLELEQEHTRNMSVFDDSEQVVERRPKQRQKKLKLLKADEDTQFSSAQIKANAENHPNILKKPDFLPRDPMLYALMEMQRTGGFVSNIIGDERSAGWAPELRGMLSLDAVLSTNENKRKRDSGIADMDLEELNAKSPRLELDLGDDDTLAIGTGGAQDATIVADDGTIVMAADQTAGMELPQFDEDEGFQAPQSREGSVVGSPRDNTFDVTRPPLVHPEDQGPVSQGTRHAVHLLRDQFGAEAEDNAELRQRAVVFQDLLPEQRTSKADATKMFFEILVLATKDAIKVEQTGGELGGDIKLRAKRGLWGAWAEREAGGEATEENTENPLGALPQQIEVGA